jgi:hypothetical protein
MPSLLTTLRDYDADLLAIIANRWDVDLGTRDAREAADQLAEVMLDAELAAYEWSRLSDRERGALQILLSAKEHKLPLAQYARLFGEVRQMGSEKRAREKPYLNPLGNAEILYYRGLIGIAYDQSATGAQHFAYVPSDLAVVLPSHETGYDLTAEDDDDLLPLDESETETTLHRRADTSLVDDICTMLAYFQIEDVQVTDGVLSDINRQTVEDYLLGSAAPARAALMIALIADLELASVSADGFFKPVPNNARKWLDQSRTMQVRSLVGAWQTSTRFNELYHVRGLLIEPAGWQNDPRLIRKTVKQFLDIVPADEWFSVTEFVAAVKEQEPDFQRPAADYESWYIRDEESNEYLKGFENWDRVDGAALMTALAGPMHWLGLADLGESAAGAMVQLTAYGRAYAELAEFPERPDVAEHILIDAEGLVQAPRTISRYDRFQLARFTLWGPAGDPFEYLLSADSLTRAAAHGIQAEHIKTFLKRTAENIPDPITTMLDQWGKTGGAEAVISQKTILETDTPEALDGILNTPELRRFLGTRLGPRAVVVREDQWQALIKEMQSRGMLVESEL